jgi:hypothetical protein
MPKAEVIADILRAVGAHESYCQSPRRSLITKTEEAAPFPRRVALKHVLFNFLPFCSGKLLA